jgi:hypothetical protein
MDDDNIPVSYKAGVCNIGPDEINKRKRIGYIGTALALFYIAAAEWFDFPQVWKLIAFAPIVYAVSGYMQARRRFCFLFGLMGISKVNKEAYTRISDEQAKSSDVRKSLWLIAEIFIISTIITLLYVFLS